jgi:hypothetical protein
LSWQENSLPPSHECPGILWAPKFRENGTRHRAFWYKFTEIPKKPVASDYTAEEYQENEGSTFFRNVGYFMVARIEFCKFISRRHTPFYYDDIKMFF